ncbi:hypothetical protein HJFPF1_00604 [Paramyrothecium foliicola]|nr:hypothetical protein HJFPF1_00604 [Paramyrothecium foliicola]
MHFRTAASAAILACAAHASAEPQPYKLAMMPVLGMSLSRRQTNGYQPEQSVCGDGNTCAEACGAGYAECAAVDQSIHCYNPEAKQQCCQDGTGNSCDDGYYCTHDTKQQTWCCPDSMDLTQCAAAYNVEGGLETPVTSTPTPVPTTSSAEPTTSAPAPVTTSTSEEIPTTSVASTSVFKPNTTTVYETTESETSTFTPISSVSTSAWAGSNSTITSGSPTQPTESVPTGTSANVPEATTPGPESGAAATGFSAILLLAAGLVALL